MKLSSSMLACALLLFASLVHAAPPANDDRAGAATLTSNITAIGSTVDATLEASEPVPAGYSTSTYQATVWWSWTPVTPGVTWHEVSTAGSSIDTVVSVWTGAGTLVHAGNGRVQFQADSAQTYRIAVASSGAARGAVSVKAFVIPTPFASISSASFTPSSVDVSAGAGSVTASLTLASSQEISGGSLSLVDPTGHTVCSSSVSSAQRTGGNVALGAYTVSLSVPQGSPSGTYRWQLALQGDSGYEAAYGWSALSALPSGTPATITVVNDAFRAWAAAQGLLGSDAAPDADPDHDRMSNVMEYACGLDPRSNDRSTPVQVSGGEITQLGAPLITMTGNGSSARLRIVYLRRLGDTSTSAVVQFSDGLNTWANCTHTPQVIATSATHEALLIEDTCCVAEKTSRFARVLYSRTP